MIALLASLLFADGLAALTATVAVAPVARQDVAQEESARAEAGSDARRGTIVVPIQGPLTEEMLALTVRSIRRAHEAEARAIVFEIDTEGGDVRLMDRLIDEIERADDLHTIAYVTQKAASAGSAIAISCQSLYMRPGANMGSALVLMVPQFFGLPVGAIETLRDDNEAYFSKIIGGYRAHWRAKAQANNRPAALAEAMVYATSAVYKVEVEGIVQYVNEVELRELADAKGEGAVRTLKTICKEGEVLNLTATECYEARMANGLATTRADLLAQLALDPAEVEEIQPSWSERLAGFVQAWGLAFLIAGLVAVFLEIKLPGFGLPGVLGILFLGLWMFGKYLAGLAEVTEVLLVVLGFGLIAVEIFVLPGTLFSGILGVVAVIAGLVLASQQTFLPQSDRPLAEAAWWANARSLSIGLVVGVGGMIAVAHFLPRIPLLNRAILRAGSGANLAVGTSSAARPLDELQPDWQPAAGAHGKALTVLRPAGKVVVDGHELDAVSEGGFIDAGGPIEVVKSEPGRLVVRARGPAA